MATEECIPFFEPGQRLTGQAAAAIVGKRFVKINGNRLADGSFPIVHAGAGDPAFGVSGWSAAIGGKVNIIRVPGIIVPILCPGALAAGVEVASDAEGRAVAAVAGNRVLGRTVNAVGAGEDGQIEWYGGAGRVAA